MKSADDDRNVTFARTRMDVVTKPDGRYLIYFSWPDLDDEADESGESASGPELTQGPWTPEAGPADV